MLLEIVACVSIIVIALLARLSWWRQRCNQLIPNVQFSFFNPLGAVMDYDGFEISGKKYAVHLGLLSAFRKWSNTFREYPLFCTWITYAPFILIHKSEAVKDLVQVKKIFKRVGFITSFNQFAAKAFLLVTEPSGKIEGSCSPLASRATCSRATSPSSTSTRTSSMHYGVNIGALENESKQYVEALHRSLDLGMARVLKFWQWPNLFYWNSNTGKGAANHLKVVHDFSRTIIEDRKRRYLNGEKADDSSKYKSLLEVLLKLHIEDQALDEKGVRQEVDTFIVALQATIKWALYMIGHHPEVQEKIHQEVDSVLEGNGDKPLSVDDLSDLKYLDCVLKECNRIYPSVPLFGRHIFEETKIFYNIETLAFSRWLYRTQRSFRYCDDVLPAQRRRYFPDPEKFDPDRFLPENKQNIPEFAYVPFGAGPRNCVGRWFGEMEVKTMVCHILRNFSIHSLDSRRQSVAGHEPHSPVVAARSH
ncbi:cytochrome P450 4V2 [Caerostris extrusa]|uniref:Cytochrome P450 4V2 n=1 Tax=Caerostris extrusa TaxID=172846 RepID=A0AAV4WTJ4_CAEEX|nr:cytochrome P450 4V2 [Caerostris extrusa]